MRHRYVFVVVDVFTKRKWREMGGRLRVNLRVTDIKRVRGPHYGGQNIPPGKRVRITGYDYPTG